MHTVFSHIIQKRFSNVNEDVATDALAFVLDHSTSARRGMTRLLRGLVPSLPALTFRTQQAEGRIRPDMWGYADAEPRVFVENKFWAGLTENQPVAYLRQLADYRQPSVLLVVAPAARENTLWRELQRRLQAEEIAVTDERAAPGIFRHQSTQLGPVLALTSWSRLLSTLEQEAADDPTALADLRALRSLCDAADIDAFVPLGAEALSDQSTPAMILQLSAIVQGCIDLAVSEEVIDIRRLYPQASFERMGRYLRLPAEGGVGAWLGVHFVLWKTHGVTPLWLIFPNRDFGRAAEVAPLLDPWALQVGAFTVTTNDGLAVALDLPVGEGKGEVTRVVVDRLRQIGETLSAVNWRPTPDTAESD